MHTNAYILHSSAHRGIPLWLSVIWRAFSNVAVHQHDTNFLWYSRHVLLWCDDVYLWQVKCTWATHLVNVRLGFQMRLGCYSPPYDPEPKPPHENFVRTPLGLAQQSHTEKLRYKIGGILFVAKPYKTRKQLPLNSLRAPFLASQSQHLTQVRFVSENHLRMTCSYISKPYILGDFE